VKPTITTSNGVALGVDEADASHENSAMIGGISMIVGREGIVVSKSGRWERREVCSDDGSKTSTRLIA